MNRITTVVSALLIALAGTTLSAQNGYKVKGIVIDDQGPVIGASVLEKGTMNGTSTGLDGDWELTVSGADALVEISCIGYTTQTFIASQVPPTVTLMTDSEFLDDVVVIAYGTVKKSDMTGSVVAIKNDEINRGAVTSPSQALLGKVSGLNITPASGLPGEGATIRIRGAASLTASNNPLIVIDGVPVTNDGGAGMGDPLASVNPNDIESFSVLKDASATAIYGSRASNGVIIITTKKGSAGRVRVSYSGSASVKQNAAVLDMMDGDQFREAVNLYHPDYAFLLTDENTDWQAQIYRLALQTDHNVSVTGGKRLPFRASVGYNFDQATIKLGDNSRYNADLNLSPKFLDNHLSINANIKGIYQSTNWANSGAVGGAIAFDPTKPVQDESGAWWNWYSGTTPNSLASYNPLSTLYDYYNNGQTLRSIGNLQADYQVHGLEDLRLNLNLGYDVARTDGHQYNEIGSYSALRATPDHAVIYQNFNLNTLVEAYADYNHTFGGIHNLDAMVGYSWQHNYVRYDNTQYYNVEPRWKEKDIYQVDPTNQKEYYLVSFFGRINYSIASKYLFTATVREDASSRFSKKNRWGFFPSLAFAWNIANEDFIKNAGAFSQLKLRLGWGRTGQQDIGDDYYPYIARYVAATNQTMRYNMGGQNVNVFAPQAFNPDIKWETTETWNLGLDFGLAADRITGTVEGYYRRTFDLLNSISIPLGTNFSNVLTDNIGEMVNKGIEVSLNFVPVETRDWHWSFGGNVTFQDTQITKLTSRNLAGYLGVTTGPNLGGTDGYTSLHRVGFAPYTFHLYEQAYDSEGNPLQNVLVDRDGDGKITEADRYVTGYSPVPDVYFGLNTRLSWRNWDFSVNGTAPSATTPSTAWP